MEVYVITKGSYSDYRICAVTLDEQEADRLQKIYSEPNDTADVEVYDTDDHQPLLCGHLPYTVIFYKYRNGATGNRVELDTGNQSFIPCVRVGGACDLVRLYAADADAAVKIAAEKRAQALAEKEDIA